MTCTSAWMSICSCAKTWGPNRFTSPRRESARTLETKSGLVFVRWIRCNPHRRHPRSLGVLQGSGLHPWGARRAANGHPAPYNLSYVEIGNENGWQTATEYRPALRHDPRRHAGALPT